MFTLIVSIIAIVVSCLAVLISLRARRAYQRRYSEVIRQEHGDTGTWTPSDLEFEDALPMPNAEEILRGSWDDLPKQVQNYIHQLETNADPAGTLRENFALRQNVELLQLALEAERKKGGA